ncbi:MAG: WD40 repeat domain-containing protein [Promethearchaeota archaeon]
MNMDEIWTYKHSEPILALELGDINGNSQIEIIATTKKGELLIFSLDGNLLQKKIISDIQSLWYCNLLDIDQDGQNEIIIGGLDGLLRAFKSSQSYELEIIWKHKFGGSISGFLFDDINGSGQQEIIAYSLDKTLRVLNSSDGTMIWGQIFEDGIGDAISWSDIEVPNHKEIIACGNDGTIRGFNNKNGELQWFKRFPEKIRCISNFHSNKGQIVATGGDDKVLHLINARNQEEIKSIEFNDYIWKLRSFPHNKNEKLLVSTYSFAYFDSSISLENTIFTSKLACFDDNLEVLWEINDINIESLEVIELKDLIKILIGTTKGEIIIVDSISGELMINLKKNSCANMVKFVLDQPSIFSCHDDGFLRAYVVDNLK